MKIELHEYEGCFSFDIEAENMKDAAALMRWARNGTKDVQYAAIIPNADNVVQGFITMGKRKKLRETIYLGEK